MSSGRGAILAWGGVADRLCGHESVDTRPDPKAQGKSLPSDDGADLREIGFRSLDFSELALRVEDEIGDELNFDAPGLRQIARVGDVLDFIEQLQSV